MMTSTDRDRGHSPPRIVLSRTRFSDSRTCKEEIHDAVLGSKGQDFYTGEPLDWSLIGRWDNEDAQRKGTEFRSEFALLPTVDHEDPGSASTALRICAWRTNDWKSDLTLEELKKLCKQFLRAQGDCDADCGSS